MGVGEGEMAYTNTHIHIYTYTNTPPLNPQSQTPIPTIHPSPQTRIMAVPAIFAFYCAWVVAMLLRPFFVFVLACLLWNAPFTMLKMRMVADTFLYMVSGEREGGAGGLGPNALRR